jgi:hypothetical protein
MLGIGGEPHGQAAWFGWRGKDDPGEEGLKVYFRAG